jgi:Fe-S-cluster containining protein
VKRRAAAAMRDEASSWIEAARDETIRAELERVYSHVAAETLQRRPLCVASGRCCNFEKFGHRLYVTGLEAAYAVVSLPMAAAAGAGGSVDADACAPATRPADDDRPMPVAPRSLVLPQIDAARERGDCPFLVDRLCSIHTIKPLGCRVYFCDTTAQVWQQDLSEVGLAMIRAIHDRHGIEYRYGEWRGMLEAVVAAAGSA